MPRTEIFGNGSSYQTTSYGAIHVKYNDNRAEITIKYFQTDNQFQLLEDSYRETKSTLNVYTFKQLKLDKLFNETFDHTQIVKYEHNWKLSLKDNQLIVYADENELAFKLTSDSNSVINDFKKISTAGICSNLPFFLDQKRYEQIKFSHLYASGTSGNFSYEYNEASLTITYDDIICKYKYGKINDDCIDQYNQAADNLKKSHYLHQWVELPNETNDQVRNNTIYHNYYSPDLNLYIKEKYDQSFPFDELIKSHFHILAFVPMYYEIIIEKDLNKHHYSFENIRLLKSMSESKLSVLTKNYSKVRKLLTLGLSMEELAQCEENRIMMIMKKFNEVEDKLETLNIKAILNSNEHLPTSILSTSQKYSPTLFARTSVSSSTSEEDMSDDNDYNSKSYSDSENGIEKNDDNDSDDDVNTNKHRNSCTIS